MIEQFQSRSKALHDDMPRVRSLPTDEQVKLEITTRKRFRNELKKIKNQLSNQIAELRKLQRDIDDMDDDQAVDVAELVDLMWTLIHAEKDSRTSHSTDPSLQ